MRIVVVFDSRFLLRIFQPPNLCMVRWRAKDKSEKQLRPVLSYCLAYCLQQSH